MRLHLIKWSASAEEDLFKHLDDPDDQDNLIEAIDEALKNFPRSHHRDKRYGTRARRLRTGGFTVIYDESDPSEDEAENEDESIVVRGGTIWVRHIWPDLGQRVQEIRGAIIPPSKPI